MPGDRWQKLANLRLFFGYMYAHPGKKLVFMGSEFAQDKEWDHETSLDWHLLEHTENQGIQRWIKDLNCFYVRNSFVHELDDNPAGFTWIDKGDWEESIVSFLRKDVSGENNMLVICNFTPVPRYGYKIGVPCSGFWEEELNSDAKEYGGSGIGNLGGLYAENTPFYGWNNFIRAALPPLGIVFLRNKR
ncbi:MAG: alpha amylase C-terminal domain-containing protein [Candidatus Omnitrophota bacterium]